MNEWINIIFGEISDKTEESIELLACVKCDSVIANRKKTGDILVSEKIGDVKNPAVNLEKNTLRVFCTCGQKNNIKIR
ncbi:MAG: hypothetical protein ACRDAT_00955 [Cetobacterium sp.]